MSQTLAADNYLSHWIQTHNLEGEGQAQMFEITPRINNDCNVYCVHSGLMYSIFNNNN